MQGEMKTVQVSIRRFEKCDIPRKVKWINDAENNAFLHYDIPICEEKTKAWFERNWDRGDRYDAVIEADGVPVGLIGLLSIDQKNRKAEYYISMGETAYKGRGIAKAATGLILRYAFESIGLNRVYLFTEVLNVQAQALFERVGFQREGYLRNDLVSHGRFVDRIAYGMLREDWEKNRAAYVDTEIGHA